MTMSGSTVISRACYEALVDRLPGRVCVAPDLEPLAEEFGCGVLYMQLPAAACHPSHDSSDPFNFVREPAAPPLFQECLPDFKPSGFIVLRVPIETLVHIHGLICQRYVKMNHHIHKANVAEYCSRSSSAAPYIGIMATLVPQLQCR